jgi:hypothetical protein
MCADGRLRIGRQPRFPAGGSGTSPGTESGSTAGGASGSSVESASGSSGTAGSGDAGGGAGSDAGGARSAGDAGTSGAGGVGACSFAGAVPAAPAAPDPAATEQAQAEEREFVTLDAVVGRFLRGDVTVYRGTVSAEATSANINLPPPYTMSNQFAEGPALAMLAIRTAQPDEWAPAQTADYVAGNTATLLIHAHAADRYLVYAQVAGDPTRTWGGGFGTDGSGGLSTNILVGSCVGCVPSLAARPATLGLSAATTIGTEPVIVASANVGVPVSTKATAALAVAPPCTLTWEDLAALATAVAPNEFAADIHLNTYAVAGDEMLAHHAGSFGGPRSRGQCAMQTDYSIDVWVKRANLASYGTRNYKAGSSAIVCPP